MPPERLNIPVRGVANTVPPRQQPADFTRPARSRNWRIDPETGRPVRRPAIRKAFAARMGGGRPVQALEVVSRASTFTGFASGTAEDLDSWTSRVSGALTGNCWLLDKNWAMERDRYENVQPSGPYGDAGPAASTVSKVKWSPDGTRIALATTYTDSGTSLAVTRITVVYADSRFGASAPAWTRRLSDPVDDRRCFDLCWSPGGEFLFAAVNDVVVVLEAGSGAVLDSNELSGLTTGSGKVAALAAWTDPADGAPYLFAGFNGRAAAGTCAGGAAISADHYGSMFRAGVMKLSINTATPATPLSQVVFGGAVPPGSTWHENDHGYFRISERTAHPPYGCYVTALAVGPDGSVYVGRTNQGGGPNSSYPPDGDAPYVTVMKISSAGARVWERDTDSIRAANFGGFANDFDVGGTDYSARVFTVVPSVIAVAADQSPTVNNRSVYAGGRRGASAATGFNLYRLAQENGGRHWRQNLSGTLRGIAVDPTDHSPVAATDRNADWTGSAGAGDLQHLFKMARFDGTVTRKFDLTANLDALGVDVDGATGRLCYGSEKR